ncbi:MAG: DUF262 domain-containing protein [Bacteroidota bacterium]|nr:DUF262 domain-containing protein [Bacteroidota bacterium]
MNTDLDLVPRSVFVGETGGRVIPGSNLILRGEEGRSLTAEREEVPQAIQSSSVEGEDGVERELAEDVGGHAAIVEPFDPARIRISTRQTLVRLILDRIERDEIDLQPDFQRRGDLWSRRTQSRLIESLLLKIPIPGFYMAADEKDDWVVIDGLQRLGTLRDFVLNQTLRLQGLEYLDRFAGRMYEQLPRPMQRRISETKLICHVIEPGTPPEVKFNIFRRINTEGKPLVAQEIRHALNPGPARDLLADLARTRSFLEVTDESVSKKRMADRECVLRFLAFLALGEEKYEGKLDDFLMGAMEFLNDRPDRHEWLRREFQRSMSLALDIFGKDAFRKPSQPAIGQRRNPVNKALFESVSVALAEVSRNQAAMLRNLKDRLVADLAKIMTEDEQFVASISVGTGSLSNVRYRFGRMRELVRGVLS